MIQRSPVKIHRTPVKLTHHMKMTLKLLELQDETREDDIFIIAKHYEMLVRKAKNSVAYSSLYRDDPKRHRNWKHFERIYEVCRMKGWDTKLYLESQFERAKGWVHGSVYPQPSQMYSVDALRAFTVYLASTIQKYENDTDGEQKLKGKTTKSVKDDVVDAILSSVESLEFYVSNSKFEDKAQYKALRIYQYWQELSPYYLWSIPWFRQVLSSLGQSEKSESCRQQFESIQGSPSIQTLIEKTVIKAEEHFNIPPNVQF